MVSIITCIDLDKKTYDVPVEKLRWRPSVYGIIIQDGQILLSPQFDGYDIPGWGINIWEKIDKALIREVHEETGMEIEIQDLIHVDSNFFVHPRHPDDFLQSILIYYRARIIWWKLSTDCFDEDEKEHARMAEWISLSELENVKWASSVDLYPIIKKTLFSIS